MISLPKSYTLDDLIRFWSKINRKGPEDCWLWKGQPHCGYGQFKFGTLAFRAHRVAYYFEHKVDPGEAFVLHTCDVKLCVNPRHLELGTHAENMQQAHDRGLVSRRGENHPNRRLNEVCVREIKKQLDLGLISQSELAHRYGVNRGTICRIKYRKLWWWV